MQHSIDKNNFPHSQSYKKLKRGVEEIKIFKKQINQGERTPQNKQKNRKGILIKPPPKLNLKKQKTGLSKTHSRTLKLQKTKNIVSSKDVEELLKYYNQFSLNVKTKSGMLRYHWFLIVFPKIKSCEIKKIRNKFNITKRTKKDKFEYMEFQKIFINDETKILGIMAYKGFKRFKAKDKKQLLKK